MGTKISALTDGGTLTSADQVPVNDSGTTKRKVIKFPRQYSISLPGPRVVANDVTNWIIFPLAGVFVKAWLVAKTGPTGASLITDLQLSTNNGSTFATLWGSTPANKPTIAAAASAGNTTGFDTTSFAAGNILRVDIDQVGSTIAGSDLTLVLECLMTK